MSTFKAGEKVEYIEDHDGRKAGTKATVILGNEGRASRVISVVDEFGKSNAAYARRFKLVEEPTMHGFTVGDKVRYTLSLWNGMEGTVHRFNNGYVDVMVTKLPDDADKYSSLVLGKTVCQTVGGQGISPSSLEKVEEKPFTYKDIQKGDKIRRTRTYTSGAVEIREGVATNPAMGGFWSDGTFILAYDSDSTNSTVVLELLERPEPEPVKAPEPWDNAKTGDVLFRVYKHTGEKDTFVKLSDGGWTIYYANGGTYGIDPGEKLAGYFLGDECVAPQLV